MKVLGPAADEVGQWGASKIKAYRTKNANKALNDAGRMLEQASIEPQAAPPKILLPLIEAASLEDHEDLQHLCAALLANAANPEADTEIRPGFISILSAMSLDEAALLKWMYDHRDDFRFANSGRALAKADVELGFVTRANVNFLRPSDRLAISIDALLGQQLISSKQWVPDLNKQLVRAMGPTPTQVSFFVSALGNAFVQACTPPGEPES